jgi:hypothetical protein
MKAAESCERWTRGNLSTRNGVPVGELIPLRQRQFVPTETAAAVFAGAPRGAPARFRKDIDSLINQDPTPRA